MSKEQPTVATSVRIRSDLLDRIDEVAAKREESRNDTICRMLRNEIDEEEAFIGHMTNPLLRAMMLKFCESPRMMKAVADLVGDQMTDADINAVVAKVPKFRRLGEEWQKERKAKPGTRPEPA